MCLRRRAKPLSGTRKPMGEGPVLCPSSRLLPPEGPNLFELRQSAPCAPFNYTQARYPCNLCNFACFLCFVRQPCLVQHIELYKKELRKGWWRASEMAAYVTPMLDFTGNFKLQEWEGCRGPPDPGLPKDLAYIASRQGFRLPIVPVISKEERTLFYELVPQFFNAGNSSSPVDLEALTRHWNTEKASAEKRIYFKIPILIKQHLDDWFKTQTRRT